jgi:hypothetical protein
MRKSHAFFLYFILFLYSCGSSYTPGKNILITVDPSYVNFGTVPINSEQFRMVLIKHSGTEGTIVLKNIYFDKDSSAEITIDIQPDNLSLEPGDTTTIMLKYAPKDNVKDTAKLILEHNVPPDMKSVVDIEAHSQVGHMIMTPDPADFGAVDCGKDSTIEVTIANEGSDEMIVTKISLLQEKTKDFQIVEFTSDQITNPDNPLPLTLKPMNNFKVKVKYTPTGGNEDTDFIVVNYQEKAKTGEGYEDKSVQFQILAKESGPQIQTAPDKVNFEYVELNVKKTVDLTVANTGSVDLVISGVEVTTGSAKGITLDNPVSEPVTIKANTDDLLTFKISWIPTEVTEPTNDPIGGILFKTNDCDEPDKVIQVYGNVDTPFIEVSPNPTEFGFVAQGVTSDREITIYNSGHAVLKITSVDFVQPISAEYEIKGFNSNPSITFDKNGGEIVPDGYVIVYVSFTNKGAASGTEKGILRIQSNAINSSTTDVNLTADRAGSPTCDPVLVPATLNFQTVPKGYSKTLDMEIYNKGTGYCSFKTARVDDCTGIPPLMANCAGPGTSPSQKFKIISVPPAIEKGLGPMTKTPIKVMFTPPKESSIFDLNYYYALLSVDVVNPYEADVSKKTITIPPKGSGGIFAGSYKPNLEAASGIAKVTAIPSIVQFGTVTIGCYSKMFEITVYNAGNAPLDIKDIKMDSCSPEFIIKEMPSLPATLSAGNPLKIKVVYYPQDKTIDTCNMIIESSDTAQSILIVPMKGEGTYDDEQWDIFKQSSGQEVDVLFVIDDSSSMCEEQDKLAKNFDHFIQYAKVWENDYHIGIIDSNVLCDQVAGKLNRGEAKKLPRFITKNDSDPMKLFESYADLGCDGAGDIGCKDITDEQESGLEAAQLAVSLPLVSNSDTQCTTDSQCTAPDKCVEGYCGGWNRGFLRDLAQLELIFLSDEEDQSSAAVAFYIDFFKNLKGFYNTNMMHMHAIVGDEGGCTSSDGSGTADGGKRYIKAAQDTNGKFGSICDPNYATVLDEIGATAFGLKVQFFLTRIADPPTIKVWVAGKSCTQGWTYQEPSNSVVFDEKGPCMPQVGDEVKIYYKTLCLKE